MEHSMKFAANTFIWSDHFGRSELSLLPKLKQAGFDGVEMPLIEPGSLRDPEIKHAIKNSGLECTFCSVLPEGLNALSDDERVRRKTREHLTNCIETAAEIGGHIIPGPLYAPVGYLPGRRRTADEWEHAVESFQQ